ncbi:relaxase/mobilization nuclease [Streptomyces sp. NPDC093225]|uniref:relaxase/mobilization nuclease n=1 Tax=Streptomyces sp. NPDC093225 TaxID=3366034 RepID=UPI00381C8069
MIARVYKRGISAPDALAEALGRPGNGLAGLPGHEIVAHWPALEYYTLWDEQKVWSMPAWAEHLNDPLHEEPFAASPEGDRAAIFHADFRLHPDDRELTQGEWAEVSHRLARAAGITAPGDDRGCRWIAVQAQPGRLDLLANLIRADGTWQDQGRQFRERLNEETRLIEADLGLRSPVGATPAPEPDTAPAVDPSDTAAIVELGSAEAHIGALVRQLSDEQTSPLATVRSFFEHSAHRLAAVPGEHTRRAALRLEWAARRLYRLQQDLTAAAEDLTGPANSTPATISGPAHHPPAPTRRTR